MLHAHFLNQFSIYNSVSNTETSTLNLTSNILIKINGVHIRYGSLISINLHFNK